MKRAQVSNARPARRPRTFFHIFWLPTITSYEHVTFSAPQLQPHIIAEAGYIHDMVICEDVRDPIPPHHKVSDERIHVKPSVRHKG
jgi:hypothetical protein